MSFNTGVYGTEWMSGIYHLHFTQTTHWLISNGRRKLRKETSTEGSVGLVISRLVETPDDGKTIKGKVEIGRIKCKKESYMIRSSRWETIWPKTIRDTVGDDDYYRCHTISLSTVQLRDIRVDPRRVSNRWELTRDFPRLYKSFVGNV